MVRDLNGAITARNECAESCRFCGLTDIRLPCQH
jgi:hypothetical protein